MIPRVTLKEIFKDTFRRSTLLAIPDISEYLVVDESMFTKWEIFYSIVRDALKNFEFYYPLCLNQKIYISKSPDNTAYIEGNFDAFIEGKISEEHAFITPSSVVGISTTSFVNGAPMRNFRYEPPVFYDFHYSSGTYHANCICKRPFIEDYNEVTGEPTNKCAIYYMSKDIDSVYGVFRDEVYLQVCRYLSNVKKNMMLSNMPIELFQGLEEDMSKLEGKLESLYNSNLTSSYWLI